MSLAHDYFGSFYADENRRTVLCDLKRYVYEQDHDDAAQVALMALFEYIRQMSGMTDDMAIAAAEAGVAVLDPPDQKKEDTYDVE